MNIAILIPELGGGGAERVAQILGNYYVKHNNKVYYFLADSTVKQDYPVEGKIIKTNISTHGFIILNEIVYRIPNFL